jgi:hypothetical protein
MPDQQEFQSGVAADVAGATGDENAHGVSPLRDWWCDLGKTTRRIW